MWRRRARLLLVTLAIAAVGAGTALVAVRSASAFPPGICHGTACTGSTTDSIPAGYVCLRGVGTFWEDSYIPADVKNPRLAKFAVTPDPPCTGATVSAPTSDPWPASNTDPNGKPAGKKEAGKAIFRFRWTVTVPADSKPVGAMNVAWTLDWTAPAGGTTETTTTGGPCPQSGVLPAHCRYDLEITISAPETFPGASARHIVATVHVFNKGPATSPPLARDGGDELVIGTAYEHHISGDPEGAGNSETIQDLASVPTSCVDDHVRARCPLPALAPNTGRSFRVVWNWTAADRRAFESTQANPKALDYLLMRASVNHGFCPDEETDCTNNETGESMKAVK